MKTIGYIPLFALAAITTALMLGPWTAPRSATGAQPVGAQQPTDTRQRITLPAARRDKVLTEMRLLLDSINKILQALVANDLPAIENAARASGLAAAADVDPQIETLLPQAFLILGTQTHKGFDALADRMKARGTREDAIKGLAALTVNCVACHAAYRIDERR